MKTCSFSTRVRPALTGLLLLVLSASWPSPAFSGGDETSLLKQYGKYGGPFALVDHNNRAVTDRDFLGRYMLLFFGYTYCPDVCPTSMQAVSDTLDILGENGRNIQPIFITIDPERDTPEMLAGFATHFHPRILGLTGDKDSIADIADDYGVTYYKVSYGPSNDGAAYSFSHSAAAYLMGPDGKFITVFPYGTSPEDMAREIRKVLGMAGD